MCACRFNYGADPSRNKQNIVAGKFLDVGVPSSMADQQESKHHVSVARYNNNLARTSRMALVYMKLYIPPGRSHAARSEQL